MQVNLTTNQTAHFNGRAGPTATLHISDNICGCPDSSCYSTAKQL